MGTLHFYNRRTEDVKNTIYKFWQKMGNLEKTTVYRPRPRNRTSESTSTKARSAIQLSSIIVGPTRVRRPGGDAGKIGRATDAW